MQITLKPKQATDAKEDEEIDIFFNVYKEQYNNVKLEQKLKVLIKQTKKMVCFFSHFYKVLDSHATLSVVFILMFQKMNKIKVDLRELKDYKHFD